MTTRQRREYLQLLDAAKAAIETAVDAFNRGWHPYRHQTTLLLITNSWELLAKAILIQQKESIKKGGRGETISAETAVHRVRLSGVLDDTQAETIQQIVSLRNAACHGVLPAVPPEIMQHLLFYATKFFRDAIAERFPQHVRGLSDNYLSLSFSNLTTYADKVQRSVARIRKSKADRKLVWLLERGISFDGTAYITEAQFEKKFRQRKKVLSTLGLSGFIQKADMVRIVPIQAPKNFTADVLLRKGSAMDSSLPVVIKKTDVEADYPYLTKELGQQIGKNQNWTAKAVMALEMKGNPVLHQAVRASASSVIHRYSQAALDQLRAHIIRDPTFNPYDQAAN